LTCCHLLFESLAKPTALLTGDCER
jgi:hypothetical protein